MREAAVEQSKRYNPALINEALSTALSILKKARDATCDRPAVTHSSVEAVPAKKKMRMFVKPTSTVASVAAADIDENCDNHVVDLAANLADEMPVVDDLSSDADASAHLPTGLGEQKRKRKSGGAQQAAKAAKCAEAEEGGYTDKGRAVYRNDGGVLVTGDKRTCVADAVSHLLPSFAIEVHVDTVRTMMSDDLDQDTKFAEADKCVRQFGLTLQRVTQRFMVKGGPELALLKSTGLFVVQLAIALDKDDKKPDKHCVAYDGATVRDNYKYAKVKEIDSTDRASPEAARAVINSLFKNMQVRIKNVYELTRM